MSVASGDDRDQRHPDGPPERVPERAGQWRHPWEAFRTFVITVAQMHARDRGLIDVLLSSDRGRERVAAQFIAIMSRHPR